jgi:hypothetical protein
MCRRPTARRDQMSVSAQAAPEGSPTSSGPKRNSASDDGALQAVESSKSQQQTSVSHGPDVQDNKTTETKPSETTDTSQMGVLATSSATPPQPSDTKMAEAKPTKDLASPQATSSVVQSASRVIARQISAAAAVAEHSPLPPTKAPNLRMNHHRAAA